MSRSAILTLSELLSTRARENPEQIAFIALTQGDRQQTEIRYGELDRRAQAMAAVLRQQAAPGTRVCLLYPAGFDFVTALFACFYAGMIAVPGYPPRSARRLPRLDAMIEDPAGALAVCSAKVWAMIQPALASANGAMREVRWVVCDPEMLPTATETPASGEPGTLAMIQYTSGSTANPKGVMLSHANFLHNLEQVYQRFGHSRESRGVIWLPPYHDMGLVGGILQPIYGNFPSVIMAPTAFLQEPMAWLRAISKYGATTSGGPNFAYELCARKVTEADQRELDLSRWDVAFTGAEPVRMETMERFAAAFAPCGFRREAFLPCYGLAEGTLMVTARHKGEGPAETCGPAGFDTDVRVVDPETGIERAPGVEGEIWVAGPSVAQGYWQRPEESAATFGATLAGGAQPYLRTGDLGYWSEGELRISGRRKDLIIVRGANYYAHDLEATAERSHAALRAGSGAAFGVESEDGEQVVLVQELEPRRYAEASEAVAAVREEIAARHGLDLAAVVLLPAGAIPKTTSGKVRRQACREAYLAGTLETLATWSRPMTAAPGQERSRDEIRAWLVSELARRLAVDSVDTTRPFHDLGVDSAEAVSLSLELEAWLGRPTPPTVVWDYPNIEALAGYLAGGASRRETAPSAFAEPIAVIGMAGRFPGAPDTRAFWELLRAGRSGIGEIPADRWNVDDYWDPVPGTPGKMATRSGGFLPDIDRFDSYFFGITPREAETMDPQQRLLLEVTWEALEDAGQPPAALAGTPAGVFVGLSNSDYARLGGEAGLDIYSGTGGALSIAANRLSYTLDLRGPSLAVDTACSSSLVAVHLACQSLRQGEANLAIAGGVNVILSPEGHLIFSQARMLAPDGQCKVFDADADGYVRGEGCGVVILKRLAEARAAGDRIYGVILGSQVNQDGRTNGLTAPNGPSQQAVMRQALNAAGVDAAAVSFVEAHGTGTSLGDPIEVQSIRAVFGDTSGACYLGSLKASVGHLEPAAGIASLIKTLLMLTHETIPPQINLRRLNPLIALEGSQLQIATETVAWPQSGARRVAINSFGFGGTNATVIVGDAGSMAPAAESREAEVLTLSAKSQGGVQTLASRYAEALAQQPERWREFCHSANTGRTTFAYRWATVANSAEELVAALRSAEGVVTADAASERRAEVGATPGELRDVFLAGGSIDGAYPRTGARMTLPGYPFERQRHWLTERETEEVAGHPLLGRRSSSAVPIFETELSLEALPYLADHRWRGEPLFPAAGYVALALQAMSEVSGESDIELARVAFLQPLWLRAGRPVRVQTVLTPGSQRHEYEFQILAEAPDEESAQWVCHCRGEVRPLAESSLVRTRTAVAGEPLAAEELYRQLGEHGLDYGEQFRALSDVIAAPGEASARVKLHPDVAAVAGDYALHPVFLDGCFHALAAGGRTEAAAAIPVRLNRLQYHGVSPSQGWVQVTPTGDLRVFSDQGRALLEVDGLALQRWETPATAVTPGDLYGLEWVEQVPQPEADPAPSLDVVYEAGAGDAAALCAELMALTRDLATRSPIPRLWVVTRQAVAVAGEAVSPEQASLWGLAATIALEYPGLRPWRVDLEAGAPPLTPEQRARLGAWPKEDCVAIRGGRHFVARLRTQDDDTSAPIGGEYRLTIRKPGNLDSLTLVPAARTSPGAGMVELRVAAAGLNFSDVLKGLGLYPGVDAATTVLGAECAGVVTAVGEGATAVRVGDEVMGIAPHCFGGYVTTQAALLVKKPAALSMAQAAALSVAFLTAWYALFRLARLQAGERVLIHAGTGGVGLAAIQLAQSVGAEIHATAGSEEKRTRLAAMNLAGVYSSRTLDFAEQMRQTTNGYGADVVLNSLPGEALVRGLELLAPHGRFVEIGKQDFYEHRRLPLTAFQKAISFFAVDLDRTFRERPDEIQPLLRELAAGLEDGRWQPLPVQEVAIGQAAQAFRTMAQAKHVGKLVLTVGAAALFSADASYLVTGGLGALGLAVAEWIVASGAGTVGLLSRSEPTAEALARLAPIRERVMILRGDVAEREELSAALARLRAVAPLRGVVHAAGQLADGTLKDMDEARLRTALRPKVDGSRNLHELTGEDPLEAFVLFSSVAGTLGSPGQANYAAANAYLDGLSSARRQAGQPALSIAWGPWADGGMATRAGFDRAHEGLSLLPVKEALRTLESLLRNGRQGCVVVARADWQKLAARLSSPLLAEFAPAAASTKPDVAPEDRLEWLQTRILAEISRVSGLDVERIDLDEGLGDLGIDSLGGLELINSLEQHLQITIPLSVMNTQPTVRRLAVQIAERMEA